MDDRLRKLEVLIGTWHTTITALEQDGKDGPVSSAIDTYRWSPSQSFVLHDVDAQMEGKRTQSLEIIALDPGSDGYNARAYEADGTFADYHADLSEDLWNITGDTLRFRGEFSQGGNRLAGQWDEKRDGAWEGLMRVTLEKQP